MKIEFPGYQYYKK